MLNQLYMYNSMLNKILSHDLLLKPACHYHFLVILETIFRLDTGRQFLKTSISLCSSFRLCHQPQSCVHNNGTHDHTSWSCSFCLGDMGCRVLRGTFLYNSFPCEFHSNYTDSTPHDRAHSIEACMQRCLHISSAQYCGEIRFVSVET